MNLTEEIDGLNFAMEKSLRYHQRRRAHYERLHKWSMLGIILAGSAAFAQVIQQPEWLGLAAAMLAALELVFGFSLRARDHELMHRGFTDLATAVRSNTEPNEDQYHKWRNRRLEIETQEPPIYWALEASCDNEVTVAWGREEHGLIPVSRWQKLMMNWITFAKTEFGPRPTRNKEQSFATEAEMQS